MIDLQQERQLQRFIDGELTIDEENDAIVQCELNPDLWRTLGLGFIEQRRIANACAAFRTSDFSTDSSRDRSIDECAGKIDNDASVKVELAHKPVVQPKRQGTWIPLAASVVAISLSIAFSYEVGRNDSVTVSPLAVNDSGSTSIPQHTAADDPVIVLVEYPAGEQVTQPSNRMATQPNFLNEKVRQVLRKVGYGVDESFDWQLVEDGNQLMVVPNQQVRLVSLQE